MAALAVLIITTVPFLMNNEPWTLGGPIHTSDCTVIGCTVIVSWTPRQFGRCPIFALPTSAGPKQFKRFGFATKSLARERAEHISTLLDLARDDVSRNKIGDMILAAKRGAALPAVEDVRRRLGLGQAPDTAGVTTGEWLNTWVAGKQRAKRASTYRGYESHVRVHINPVIGHIPLERLNFGHIEAVLAAVPGRPVPGTGSWRRCEPR
jgi:hypothetical protein